MAAVRLNVGGIRHLDIGPASAASARSLARLVPVGDPPGDVDAMGCGPVERRTLTPEEAAARGFTIGERVTRLAANRPGTLRVNWSRTAALRGTEVSAQRTLNRLPEHSDEKVLEVVAACRTRAEAARRLGTSETSLYRRLAKIGTRR